MPRPHKLNAPTRTLNCVLLKSQYADLSSIAQSLSKTTNGEISMSDLVRIGVDRAVEMTATEILDHLQN